MTLTNIMGSVGSGKSLLAVALAKYFSDRGEPVYANFKLKLDNAQYIKPENLLDIKGENNHIFMDEFYGWADSRVSTSYMNRFLSQVLFQSRKLGFDMYTISQDFSSIDKRWRNMSDVLIYAQRQNDDFRYYGYVNSIIPTHFRFKITNPSYYFQFYDTYETIMTIDEYLIALISDDPKRINELVDDIAMQYLRQFNYVDKSSVRDFLTEKGIPDKYSIKVYDRIKKRKEVLGFNS